MHFTNNCRAEKTYKIAALLLSLILGRPALSQNTDGQAWGIALLESESYVDCIRMPIQFGALRGDLVVDTGAEHSLLDQHYIKYCIGNRTIVNVEDGNLFSSRLHVYQFFKFRFLNDEYTLSPIGIVDLAGVQEALGGPIVGILGYKFLVDNRLTLGYEYKSQQFYLSKDDHGKFPLEFSFIMNAESKPLVSDILIDELLNNSNGFLVDSGKNSALSVSSQEYEYLKESGRLFHERDSSSVSLFGSRDSRRAVLDKAFVFGKELYNIPIHKEKDDQNTIGLALLRQFDFVLDPHAKKIYVRHHSSDEQYFRCDLSGVSVMQKEFDIVVREVKPDIFPGAAVLHPGDSIKFINGGRVTSLAFVRQAFCTYSSGPVKLSVYRKGQMLDVDLSLNSPESLGLTKGN